MVEWLELSVKQETDYRVIDIIKCLGGCLFLLCRESKKVTPVEFRTGKFDKVLTLYFELSYDSQNKVASKIRNLLETMFIDPTGMYSGSDGTMKQYQESLLAAWNKFDKVPYTFHSDNGSVKHFESKVMKPIRLDR